MESTGFGAFAWVLPHPNCSQKFHYVSLVTCFPWICGILAVHHCTSFGHWKGSAGAWLGGLEVWEALQRLLRLIMYVYSPAISGHPVIWSIQMQQVLPILFTISCQNMNLVSTLSSWQDCPDWGFGVWHSLHKITKEEHQRLWGFMGETRNSQITFPNFSLSNKIFFRETVQLYEFSGPCWHLGFPRRSHSLTGSFWQ